MLKISERRKERKKERKKEVEAIVVKREKDGEREEWKGDGERW